MRGQAGPSAKEITSVKEYEKFISQDDNAVFGLCILLFYYDVVYKITFRVPS